MDLCNPGPTADGAHLLAKTNCYYWFFSSYFSLHSLPVSLITELHTISLKNLAKCEVISPSQVRKPVIHRSTEFPGMKVTIRHLKGANKKPEEMMEFCNSVSWAFEKLMKSFLDYFGL